ncbi:Solvent efflux pump periplasmic linker SrpA precursor [Symmachiella macrocystis]|uniref:Solvent efflux pump periplasmic linker SrpA n=1 Tax=Symmachiella macrocystis TaxID=2527985 RepID=A0A5C6BRA4_9PLAN|nr:efflux RND transporter periplasmic adaptor subunit [Symmachiella macrocystis]TWU14763.1 Solvent efflux pump periplasmic linker SrpA precursor [Symmachiella macrocystis]
MERSFSTLPSLVRAWPMGFCLIVVGLSGCVERTVALEKTPPPEVTTGVALQREIVDSRQFPGRVAAVENVEIRARVTGYITEVNFVEGDVVDVGALLFQIDPRPFQEVLNAAESEIERWQASIAKNKADLDRQTRLLKSGAGIQEDFDQAEALVLQSQAALKGSQAAVDSAKLDLEFTTIIAPVKGRVSRALVTKGNLVTADQSSGTPLTTLVSVDPMYVYFDVDEFTMLEAQRISRTNNPEARHSRVRDQKRPVFIGLANEKGFPHQGVIDFVDNQVDPTTGTLRVRGRFDNTDEYLSAGLFVKVRIPLGQAKTELLVPQTAIGTDLNQKFVLVVDAKNKVIKKPVELGTLTDDGLQVIESGVSAEDRIIINGAQRVRDGDTVKATEGEIIPVKAVTEPAAVSVPGDVTPDGEPADAAIKAEPKVDEADSENSNSDVAN